MAEFLFMDISSYNRRENGQMNISTSEWGKMAEILEVPVEAIFEEDKMVSINYENSTLAENSGNLFSTCNNIPESIIKNLQDFIKHLQEENVQLKEKLKRYED